MTRENKFVKKVMYYNASIMSDKIRGLFTEIGTHSTFRFILELSLIAFFIKIPFLIISGVFFTFIGMEELVNLSDELQTAQATLSDFFFGVILAPSIETVFGQWIPIAVGSIFLKKTRWVIIFSAIIFALFHFPAIAFAPGAFLIGLLLAWCWLLKRKTGRWEAFWVTTSVHALHNLYAFLLTVLVPLE